ncbi:MAG: M18 family aminopeptidase [Lachnospiraceae bacterium]|nr:M18 family aminopeptidase [Lachnospiraceae bacterium]
MKDAIKCSGELLKFIENSPSCFHAIRNVASLYEKNGFQRLEERESWHLEWGKSYYVVRNDSALIAFRLTKQKEKTAGFHMAAAHCDSPTFKIKENPERKSEQYLVLNVEKYGGMIHSTWLDRPLSVAGRIVVQDKKTGRFVSKLVDLDQDLLVIPSVAIHMNREVNKGTELNPQTDLQPLFALQDEEGKKSGQSILGIAAKVAGVKQDEILGHDLFLYVREKGRFLGPKKEFILSPKLDDLQCVYALSESHAQTKPGEYVTICAVFDNEEVGSGSIQGADSTFLEDVILRIGEALQLPMQTIRSWVADGFMISADNAHAVHPNHPEKADPTNRPYLNGGVVLKYNSSQKYTTDGMTGAKVKSLCRKADVPVQSYVNRSDIPGGSTLGNISTAHVSVPSADIGLPQLAMHSAVETGGTKDTAYAMKMMRQYFSE